MLSVSISIQTDNPNGSARIARKGIKNDSRDSRVSTDIVKAALQTEETIFKVRCHVDEVKVTMYAPAGKVLKTIPTHGDIVDIAKDLLAMTYMDDLFDKRRVIKFDIEDVVIKVSDGSSHVLTSHVKLQNTSHIKDV